MTISTKQLTNEELRQIIDSHEKGHGMCVPVNYGYIAAKELLAVREAQSVPVQWGAPKTVRQLIQQLQTLDQDLETTALLRMPADFRDGNAIRQVPLSISYERLNGQWLAPYKSDDRLVLAFWAKADDRPEGERGELLTAPPTPAAPTEGQLLAFAERHRLKLDKAWLLQIWEDAISLAAAPTPTNPE